MSKQSIKSAIPSIENLKSKLSAERCMLQHEVCLIGETANPHCFIAKRKLKHRIAQITHILDTVASPSTTTAKSPEATTAVSISSPKTAVTPNLERSEKTVTTMMADVELKSLNLDNVRHLTALLVVEKVFATKCMERLKREEKRSIEIVSKQVQKAEKAKAEVDAIMRKAEKESDELNIVTGQIGEMIAVLENRTEILTEVVENWNELTSKLNGENKLILSWGMEFIKILYTIMVYILYVVAMIRDVFVDAGKTSYMWLQTEDGE